MARKFSLIPAKDYVEAIERRYARAEREIREALMRIDIGSFSEMTAISAQNKVDSLVKRLNKDASRWAISAVKDAYMGSTEKVKVMLDVLGAEKDPMFDNKEHYRTMNGFMDTIAEDFFKANTSIKQTADTFIYLARMASQSLGQIQAFDPQDETIVGDIIADTIEKQESRQYAYGRIYEYFRLKLLDGNFIDRRGRHYNLKSYSELVARTRLREAETGATKNMCKQFNNDLVRVSKHFNPCEKCKPYEDKVYSLSGTHPTYPLLPVSMPIHPRCKHSISPTSEEAIKFRGQYS